MTKMSGWRRKTLKLGVLPNCTHEPRKLVPLGTMLKNSTECKSGIIICNNVVQNAEIQIRKKCSRDASNFPDSSKILVHSTEVL